MIHRLLHRFDSDDPPVAARVRHAASRLRGLGDRTDWAAAVEAILARQPRRVTVDVFDTVLARALIGDRAIDGAIGRALIDRGEWTGTAESYVSGRDEARRGGFADRPIDQWYAHDALATADGWRAAIVEASVEASICQPVPGAATGLDCLRNAGIELTFVSDMHIPERLLRPLLSADGLIRPGEELVVSCERSATKSAGTLFPALLGDNPSTTVHLGNDRWADIAMAEQAGAGAVRLGWAEPDRYERRFGGQTGTAGPAIAGAARLARLAVTDHLTPDGSLEVLGAGVGGQAFTAFLLWVRDTCESEGIDRIAFCSRDGELPLRMARALPEDHFAGFDLTYLECNRRTLMLPAATRLGVERWIDLGTVDANAALLNSHHLVPFSAVLARAGLRPADVESNEALAGHDPAVPLPDDLVASYVEFLRSPRALEVIERESAATAPLVEGYLAGLGFGHERVAVVDVGWRGFQARLLDAVIRNVTAAAPIHLHFGGYEVAADVDSAIDLRRFAFDDRIRPLPFDGVANCAELFTGSGAAPVIGYVARGEGGVVPVHGDPEPAVANGARERLWAGAVATAANLPSRARLAELGCDGGELGGVVAEALTDLWLRPSRHEARAAQRLAFEPAITGDVVSPVAVPYRVEEIRDRSPQPRQWRAGSLAITPPLLRAPVKAMLQAKDRRARSQIRSVVSTR